MLKNTRKSAVLISSSERIARTFLSIPTARGLAAVKIAGQRAISTRWACLYRARFRSCLGGLAGGAGALGSGGGPGAATGSPNLARKAGGAVSLPARGARGLPFGRGAGGGGADGAGGPGSTMPSTAARRACSVGVRGFTASSPMGIQVRRIAIGNSGDSRLLAVPESSCLRSCHA